MKKFFKENSYVIVKLIVFQLGVMIMGLVTSFATGGDTNKVSWLFPVSSIFCILFYLYLVFTVGYENGQKDGIRIEAGKISPRPYRFFLVGLSANAVNLILGILALVFRLVIGAPLAGALDPEIVYSPAWAHSAYEVCNLIARFIQSMYTGLIQTISPGNVLLVALIPLPAVLVAGISYLFGVRFKDGFIKKKGDKSGTKRYS